MKKILIICNNPDKYQHIAKMEFDGLTQVEVCSYKDLAFFIDGDKSRISIFSLNSDIRDYSKIIVLATSPNHRQNYIFGALACYCKKFDIPMLDDTFSNNDGKLFALWKFWQYNIPVAKTAFGPVEFLIQKLAEMDGIGVLKSVQGTKGRDNYLIKSEDELRQNIEKNLETHFILQNYIPNDGDWRIILINFEPRLAIYRSSNGKDHRNNTSVGGNATLVQLEDVDSRVLRLATEAARALDVKIAGADIIQDKNTGEYTVLEVNRTPQLVTGAFVDEKLGIIQNLIRS